MNILKRVLNRTEFPVLTGACVTLRLPRLADFQQWAAVRQASRGFLAPWEPVWPADDLTKAAFRRRVRLAEVEMEAGTACRFLVFHTQSQALIGGVTLSHIRRGSAHTGTVGYWIGESHARRGLMTDAVRTVQAYAFGPLGLRRLEAACLPANTASIGLLEKTGFQREGYARAYLQIAGRWHDHLLYAVLESDLQPSPK